MTGPFKKDTATLQSEVDALWRELRGTQEMFAHVLLAVGEPVIVTKESVAAGLPTDLEIRVDDDLKRDVFVFSLQEAN